MSTNGYTQVTFLIMYQWIDALGKYLQSCILTIDKKTMVTYNDCISTLELTELHVVQGTNGMFLKIVVYVSMRNFKGLK